MPLPIRDHDSDLRTGDTIDLQSPPRHCGFLMNVFEAHGGYLLACRDDDYEIHTDEAGVLTEPPHITA